MARGDKEKDQEKPGIWIECDYIGDYGDGMALRPRFREDPSRECETRVRAKIEAKSPFAQKIQHTKTCWVKFGNEEMRDERVTLAEKDASQVFIQHGTEI